mgnify:CR=1 FL=1
MGCLLKKECQIILLTTLGKIFGLQTTYCEECVYKIKRYIENLSLTKDADK